MSAIVLSVEYQVNGGAAEPTLTRLVTAFERAGAELADMGKHVLPRLLPALEAATAKQFDAQGGGPASGPWAPLSAKYASWKAKVAPGAPINVLSGTLRAALVDGGSANARREVSGSSLSFGTTGVPYASVKQTGSGKEPARPPFDFGSDFEADLQKAAMAGVREAVRAGSEGLLDFEGETFDDEGVTRTLIAGARGGRYFVNATGGRTYVRRTASGRTVAKSYKGRG